MSIRTDLAIETRDLGGDNAPSGVNMSEEQRGNISVNRIEVLNSDGERELGKPQGRYTTITAPPFGEGLEASFEEIELISKEIADMLPQNCRLVFVAGLGNREITPDALGPRVSARVLATRHIEQNVAAAAGLSGLKPVASLSPGVLGQTGVETGEIIASVVKEIKPDAVIVVDALASKSLERLGCTIQISDTGITPGSGVQNSRKELSKKTLGVPVIAIGVPTVVDAATLAEELTGGRQEVSPNGVIMMVTPREIDVIIERAANVVSLAVNKALQPALSLNEIEVLVS